MINFAKVRKKLLRWSYSPQEAERTAKELSAIEACEICGRYDLRLCLDHDHGFILARGVLCTSCNYYGLGSARLLDLLSGPHPRTEWHIRAIAYLERAERMIRSGGHNPYDFCGPIL